MSDLPIEIILERARPKKPLGTYYQQLTCPTCRKRLPSGEGSSRGTQRAFVCNHCFQVIDWSEREDLPLRKITPPIGYQRISYQDSSK